MALIESTAFDAVTGVASDLDTMLKAAAGAPVVEIVRAVRNSKHHQLALAKRILELAERDFDVRYLNPTDTAVTTYLWILANASPSLAEAVATTALGLRNGWWAPRISRRILGSHREFAPATTGVWLSVPRSIATVILGTAPREESAISALGLARHLREADRLAEGSTVSMPSSGSVTRTFNVLGGVTPAFGGAGSAVTANDNLALAA